MEPQLDQRLKAIEERISDIDKKVTKIRSAQKTAFAMKGVYWVFIILLGFGALYYVQPYIEQIKGIYSGAQSDLDSFNSLLDQFKGTDR